MLTLPNNGSWSIHNSLFIDLYLRGVIDSHNSFYIFKNVLKEFNISFSTFQRVVLPMNLMTSYLIECIVFRVIIVINMHLII